MHLSLWVYCGCFIQFVQMFLLGCSFRATQPLFLLQGLLLGLDLRVKVVASMGVCE